MRRHSFSTGVWKPLITGAVLGAPALGEVHRFDDLCARAGARAEERVERLVEQVGITVRPERLPLPLNHCRIAQEHGPRGAKKGSPPHYELRVRRFPGVGDIVRVERPHLGAVQSEQRDGVSVVADKFYLEGRAVAMHQHRRAHIAAH